MENITDNFVISPEEYDIMLRIVISIALGFIIGIEREITNKWAGLRTHILVCAGSCVFTVLSIFAFPKIPVAGASLAIGDPARVAAQIITGIGFIGGGTVLRHGSSVYGLTTAATLWIAAAIGMAAGTGSFDIAIVTSFLTFAVLVLIRKFEKRYINPNKRTYARIKLMIMCKEDNCETIIKKVKDTYPNIEEIIRKKSSREDNLTKLIVRVEVNEKYPINSAYEKIRAINEIETLSVGQDYYE